jgi:radical SAM superfamily enzyme YgiQ (UPF0313 family)
MKRKVLMIYPEIPRTFWGLNRLLPYIGKKSVMPPLGLMHVASLLPENYEVKLIDMNVQKLKDNDIKAADMIFLSAMNIQQVSFEKVVTRCKKFSKTIVAGGPIAWSISEQIKGVDHFIFGEAEPILHKFLSDYENGTAQKIYSCDEKPDITNIPPPRMDIIDVHAYVNMPLQFSRGCPFNCEFCDIIEMFGRKVRTKTPEQFIREVETVYASGFRGQIFIVDDNFIGDRKRAKSLLRSVAEWQKAHDYPYTLSTEASIDLAIDDELLDLMVESNFNQVFIGIESPDPDTLNATQKRQNTRQDLIVSLKKIQSKGIVVMGGFIIGFDSDKESIFDHQISFIRESGITLAMVGLLAAMPNTQLWRRLQKENRIKGTGYHSGNNIDMHMNFKPVMNEQKLIEGYKRVLKTIFTPAVWYERHLILLEHLPQVFTRKVARVFPPDTPLLKKMFLSVTYILLLLRQIVSPYGLQYLKFAKAAFKVNKAYAMIVIVLASSGFHYFKIANDVVNAE